MSTTQSPDLVFLHTIITVHCLTNNNTPEQLSTMGKKISKLSQITYNNFEISLVVFMPNITTNHAITYTNSTLFFFFLPFSLPWSFSITLFYPWLIKSLYYMSLRDECHPCTDSSLSILGTIVIFIEFNIIDLICWNYVPLKFCRRFDQLLIS